MITTTKTAVATEANNMKFALKKIIKDLKGTVDQKEFEIEQFKRNIKHTDVKLLRSEINTYKQECIRMRKVCEHYQGELFEMKRDKVTHENAF